jgi:prepilin-type N-terminal cleavage/methylation domain-containing protein
MLPSVRSSRGFSLVELCIVIAIAGLLVAAVISQYTIYLATKATGTTTQNANTIQAALASHMLVFGALPCPAPPMLAPGTPAAGVGDCTMANPVPLSVGNPPPAITPATPPVCSPTTGICVTPGSRQSASSIYGQSGPGAFFDGNPTHMDPVLIGSVPWIDLGIGVNAVIDGYGNRFTYAVSYYDTQQAAVQWGTSQNPAIPPNQFGAINIEAYNAATVPQISNSFYSATNVAGTPTYHMTGTYMLAIISHGPDGMGAYNYYGLQAHPCLNLPSDVAPNFANGYDVENCNNDNTFLLNGSNVNDPNGNMYSLVAGPTHYDDTLAIFDVSFSVDLWSVQGAIGTMTNNLGGNVGIGTSSPNYPLDVQGNIQTVGLQADTLCQNGSDPANPSNPSDCFPTANLLTSGMTCQGQGIVTGISQNAVQCLQQVNLGSITPLTCAPSGGQPTYVTGIDSAGNLLCQP